MENRDATSILNNPRAPYINQLATRYASADQYYAISHPSLPNYLTLIGGDTFGVDSDWYRLLPVGPEPRGRAGDEREDLEELSGGHAPTLLPRRRDREVRAQA